MLLASIAHSDSATCRQVFHKHSSVRSVHVGTAGHFGRRTFDHSHHIAERDLFGIANKFIAARSTAHTPQPGSFELQQDLHEKAGGNAVGIGDRANAHRIAAAETCRQFQTAMQAYSVFQIMFIVRLG